MSIKPVKLSGQARRKCISGRRLRAEFAEVLAWAKDADRLLHKQRTGAADFYQTATTLVRAQRVLDGGA